MNASHNQSGRRRIVSPPIQTQNAKTRVFAQRMARLRRHMVHKIGRWLSLRRPAFLATPPHRISPNTVVIVRPNRRLGNSLLLIPLIKAIAQQYPECGIDLILSHRGAADLLQLLPQVNRCWVFDPALRRRPLELIRWLYALRQQKFDVAVDPVENSTTGRLMLMFCQCRQRWGLDGPEQWVPLHQRCAPLSGVKHAGLRPLAVMPQSARVKAALTTMNICFRDVHSPSRLHRAKPRIGLCSVATGDKQYPPEQWMRLLTIVQERIPDAELIEFLPLNRQQGLADNVNACCPGSPREYADAIQDLSVFVVADSGPMHLAAACGIPTVGLFKVTDPEVYAPLNPLSIALCCGPDDPAVIDAIIERIPCRSGSSVELRSGAR